MNNEMVCVENVTQKVMFKEKDDYLLFLYDFPRVVCVEQELVLVVTD